MARAAATGVDSQSGAAVTSKSRAAAMAGAAAVDRSSRHQKEQQPLEQQPW